MLAAGLDGIENGMEPPAPVEENVYTMTDEQRKRRGIKTLPGSLDEAVALPEKSALVKRALGDHVFNAFIKNKKVECNQYRIQVTEYEIKKYLPIL
jgi:glutamine synthetase